MWIENKGGAKCSHVKRRCWYHCYSGGGGGTDGGSQMDVCISPTIKSKCTANKVYVLISFSFFLLPRVAIRPSSMHSKCIWIETHFNLLFINVLVLCTYLRAIALFVAIIFPNVNIIIWGEHSVDLWDWTDAEGTKRRHWAFLRWHLKVCQEWVERW